MTCQYLISLNVSSDWNEIGSLLRAFCASFDVCRSKVSHFTENGILPHPADSCSGSNEIALRYREDTVMTTCIATLGLSASEAAGIDQHQPVLRQHNSVLL